MEDDRQPLLADRYGLKFILKVDHLNNIPEISNEVINLIDFNEPSCSYNGWQRTANKVTAN